MFDRPNVLTLERDIREEFGLAHWEESAKHALFLEH